MENASKALLMAGGVLMALVIIGALVNSLTTVKSFQMSQLSEEEQEELIAFNEQYTKYLNQYVYGTEVITVINKTLNNTEYPITTKIKFAGEYKYNGYKYNEEKKRYEKVEITIKKGETIDVSNLGEGYEKVEKFISSLYEVGINEMAFKCTKIEFGNTTGRVTAITFEEKQWGDLY